MSPVDSAARSDDQYQNYKVFKLSPAQVAVGAWYAQQVAGLVAEGKWSKWTPYRLWRSTLVSSILKDYGEKPLSATDKTILQFVSERYNEKQKRAWPTLDQIARGCGLSTRTVQRSLARLEWVGALTGTRNKGKETHWRLVGHDGAERSFGIAKPVSKKMPVGSIASLRKDRSTHDMNVMGSGDAESTTHDTDVVGTDDTDVMGTHDMDVMTPTTSMSGHIREDKSPDKESDKSPRAFGAPPEGGYIPPSSDGDMHDGASLDERSSTEPVSHHGDPSFSISAVVGEKSVEAASSFGPKRDNAETRARRARLRKIREDAMPIDEEEAKAVGRRARELATRDADNVIHFPARSSESAASAVPAVEIEGGGWLVPPSFRSRAGSHGARLESLRAELRMDVKTFDRAHRDFIRHHEHAETKSKDWIGLLRGYIEDQRLAS